MAAPGLSEALERLCAFDTPTVCNAKFSCARVRGIWMAHSLCFPEMPPIAGYAATATRQRLLAGGDVYSTIDAQVESSQVPVHPLSYFRTRRSSCGRLIWRGDVHYHKAFGAVGLIMAVLRAI